MKRPRDHRTRGARISWGTVWVLLLALLFGARSALGGDLTLAWNPVASPALAGYVVHYGPSAGRYTAHIDVGNTTIFRIANLVDGATYHFAVTAYDAAHIQSAFSHDVSAVIRRGAPVADFRPSTMTGKAPLAVNFSNRSNGDITAHAWTFGDGTRSSAQNPSHVYWAAGAYAISLTVTGPGGTNTQFLRYLTVAPPGATAACPCSLWNSAATPSVAADPEAKAVELGVRFKSDKKGQIVGIRFYKSASNTGSHVGSLWTNAGRLLARATFTRETVSGWQQVYFDAPVSIAANTLYVASYHTNVGRYAADNEYFSSKAVDTGPLHALRSTASAGNGVYAYGSQPAFPRSTYRASNYWVDPVFVQN
jgi:PKD repeat protein